MNILNEDGRLVTSVDIKRKAKLAGTHASAYWVNAIAPEMRALSTYQRQLMCNTAFLVSTNIIPTPTLDNTLLPALLKKPMPDTIKWMTLGQQYGVDYRYIAAAYLRSLERLLARTDELTRAKLTRRSQVTNTSIVQLITSICVQKITNRADLNAFIGTGKFPNTLANFAKYDTFTTAASNHIKATETKKRLANLKYDPKISWAHWREERRKNISDRADQITTTLIEQVTANPAISPLKCLAQLVTTVTLKRPPVAAVLAYAHAHVFKRLMEASRWDIAETINAHAIHFGHTAPPQSRVLISRLTGARLPDTPPPGDDKASITALVQRCRAWTVNANAQK